LPSVTVEIPGVQSNSLLLNVYDPNQGRQVHGSYGTSSDVRIEPSSVMVGMLVNMIIAREMDQLRRDNPGFDVHKIQQMWQSGDSEMKNLAINTMKVYTKYTYRIMMYIENSKDSLECIIEEYQENNKFNLGGVVW